MGFREDFREDFDSVIERNFNIVNESLKIYIKNSEILFQQGKIMQQSINMLNIQFKKYIAYEEEKFEAAEKILEETDTQYDEKELLNEENN